MTEDELIAIILNQDSAPAFPSGALGMWFANDYAATPRPHIPNRISPTTGALLNLCTGSSHLFSRAACWNLFNVVATDDYATDSEGDLASRLVMTGDSILYSGPTYSFPAGTYTLAVNAQRTGGSDQQFCLTATLRSTRSSVFTATASMQRFSYTFTKGASWSLESIGICSIDGSTAADILVKNFELYAGASDLGPEAATSTLILGRSAYDTTMPTESAGELNLVGGCGMIQFENETTYTEVTMLAVISKVSDVSVLESVLSKCQDFSKFTLHTTVDHTAPQMALDPALGLDSPGYWHLKDTGYHLLVMRGNASERSFWIDDLPMFTVSTGMNSVAARDFWVGMTTATNYFGGSKLQMVGIYNRMLTDQECHDAYDAAVAELAVPITDDTDLILVDGDSISAPADSFIRQINDYTTPPMIGRSFAVGGSYITGQANSLTTRAPLIKAIIAARRNAAQRTYVSFLIGANDLELTTAALYLADMEDYADDIKSAGSPTYVIPDSQTPQNDVVFNAIRATLRPLMLASTHFDAVSNLGADATYGQDADAADPAKYPDGTHPSQTTQNGLAPVSGGAIDALR